MKRILVNGTQPEEVRVAMVNGQHLYDFDIENASFKKKKNNIYKGKITRVEGSLEAAFVDYGQERHGFLPFKEISREYFQESSLEGDKRPTITDAIKEGQEVIVQVAKEERSNKGAALTTFVSVAGRYLVLMPNNPRAGGISRAIEGEERKELRDALAAVDMPKGAGVIVRTAGGGKTTEELQWDLDYLQQTWSAIAEEADKRPAPFLIYEESNIIVRVLRDYFKSDIGEILVDNKDMYTFGKQFMTQVMPHNLPRFKYYEASVPMFNHYQVEAQIESAFNHEVVLPSGGSIVIDPTEALIAIDINSARATSGKNIEETALNANLEAADEIARQLRLRDIGGLIVVDFIDMLNNKNQREVENRLRQALKMDRARVQIGKISRFGLLEMSRQRLRSSLGEATSMPCPRCSGMGHIRGVQSLSLSIFRLMQEEALKESTDKVVAQVPVVVATYLLNEKRDDVNNLQSRTGVEVVIVPNISMDTPQYDIERVKLQKGQKRSKPSYGLVETVDETEIENYTSSQPPEAVDVATPAVQQVVPNTPAPQIEKTEAVANKPKSSGGFIAWLKRLFGSDEAAPAQKKKPNRKPHRRGHQQRQNRGQQAKGGRSNNRRHRGNRQQRNNKPQGKPHNHRQNQGKPQNSKPDGKPSQGGKQDNRSQNSKAQQQKSQQSGSQQNKPQSSKPSSPSDKSGDNPKAQTGS